MAKYDAVVVGSGPNGFAAAITLAQAKLSVLLIEGKSTIGGGMRSAELTLPGFIHDVCSAIHPLGLGSPFFSRLPLEKHGLAWIQPTVPLAHPFTDGSSVILDKSIAKTLPYLLEDGIAYKKLIQPFVHEWGCLADDILAPLHFPMHPIMMARFGFYGVRSAQSLVDSFFKQREARALFAGLAAHAIMPLDKSLTAAFGLILGTLGHAVGWPMPAGGTQKLADALAAYFLSIGGEIAVNQMVEHLEELPPAKAILLDVTPKQLLKLAGNQLPESYRASLEKYRYGSGIFKMDWALNHPIPWKDKKCAQAGTVHLGGSFEEIAASERLVWDGKMPANHFILVAQPSLFDPSRSPAGKHTAWAYCHVPSGSTVDLTEKIESQIELYAPGFKDCILARHSMNTVQVEKYNPNYIGGDINGGVQDISQLFTRPTARLDPYTTPVKGLYLCSSSTPPGGGVHGMCGYHAAQSALKLF